MALSSDIREALDGLERARGPLTAWQRRQVRAWSTACDPTSALPATGCSTRARTWPTTVVGSAGVGDPRRIYRGGLGAMDGVGWPARRRLVSEVEMNLCLQYGGLTHGPIKPAKS